LSREREKSLDDFVEVFEWTQAHGFDAVVIGGLAVGAFSAKLGASSLSGDLDLLVSPGEQQRIARAAASDPNVEVLKAMQPRALPVLVLGWGELEVDVLSESDGLSSPAEAIQRAWDFDGISVADPVDLLTIKRAMKREKDLEHIEILRVTCEGIAQAKLKAAPGRDAFDFLRRWVESEAWACIPEPLFLRLLAATGRQTSAEARRYLAQHAPTASQAEAVASVAPSSEHQALLGIRKSRFG